MKYTTHGNGLIRDENGNLLGVNLGWDFTAEHEWGTKGIKQRLGVEDKGYGPDRYKITNVREIKTQEYTIKGTGRGKNKTPDQSWYVISCYRHGDATSYLPGYYNEKTDVIAAWSGDSGFVVGIRDKAVFEAIVNALTGDDAIITNEQMFASEQNPFSGSGLKIVIRSAIPQEWTKQWIEAHKDYERLVKVAEKTGIADKLKNAKRSYFALSPRWINNDLKTRSKYSVMFWLNPMEQDRNNFGWYTVEDLEAWVVGSGPIPKGQEFKIGLDK